VALVGPTASGKSAVGLEVARRTGARILSLDSMQVYRRMDIGTAKPTPAEQAEVQHSMIDLVDPSEEYSVQDFQIEARAVIEASDGPVLAVGGSGLHMRAVIDPLQFLPTDDELRAELEDASPDLLVDELLRADDAAGSHVDLANTRRVVRAVEVHRLTGRTPTALAADPMRQAVARYEPLYTCPIFGLDPCGALGERIDDRLRHMLERGLVEEVDGLVGELGRTASQAVGYKELAPVVRGERSLDEGVADVRRATLALARRQRAWFRRDPRVRWVVPLRDDPVATVMAAMGAS
jgi:tRNA dimethylallyltransferase